MQSTAISDSTITNKQVTTHYFNEIGSRSLLSQEDEIKHAQTIRNGFSKIIKLINNNKNHPELARLSSSITHWQRRDLTLKPRRRLLNHICTTVKKWQETGEQQPSLVTILEKIQAVAQDINSATDTMIRANLRLVIAIAGRNRERGLPMADLIQEGNLGLMRAVFRYDHTTGNRFSTYASWWIRQAVMRAVLYKDRVIKLPMHFLESRRKYFKATLVLSDQNGNQPSLQELANETRMGIEKIKNIAQSCVDPISLETTFGDTETPLIEYLENEKSISPYDTILSKQIANQLKEIIATLSKREQTVIRLRYGLGNEPQRTLEEIGGRFNVSRERIRQIEQSALKRLRHPKRSDKIRSLYSC